MSSQVQLAKIIMKEFEKRKLKNPSYSMRAFSRFLDIDQSTLSKFLSRNRDLSWKTMEKCLRKLAVPPEVLHDLKKFKQHTDGKYEALEDSVLIMLSDWSYWAILEYFKISQSPEVKEIADHLGLKISAVKKALLILENLGFVEKHGSTYILLKPNNSWIESSKTSKARKELQKKYLQLSLGALERYSIKHRQHGSLTVAIDQGLLPEIKEKINRFQEDLGNFCQRKGRLKSIYQMQISFFPLSKVDE